MKAAALLLLLSGGWIAACGDDHSSGQQDQSGVMGSNPMMAPDNSMMGAAPLMQMTPSMAR